MAETPLDAALAFIGQFLTAVPELADFRHYEDPPDKPELPALLVYPTSGEIGYGSHDPDGWEFATITIEAHVSRSPGLARARANARALLRPIKQQLLIGAESAFGGSVVMIGNLATQTGTTAPIRWTIEPMDWNGDVKSVAAIFEVDVTIQEAY